MYRLALPCFRPLPGAAVFHPSASLRNLQLTFRGQARTKEALDSAENPSTRPLGEDGRVLGRKSGRDESVAVARRPDEVEKEEARVDGVQDENEGYSEREFAERGKL